MDDDELGGSDARALEGLEVEARRHPDLVHAVASRDPLGRHAIGLEHSA